MAKIFAGGVPVHTHSENQERAGSPRGQLLIKDLHFEAVRSNLRFRVKQNIWACLFLRAPPFL